MNLPIQNKTKNLTALLLTVIMLLFVACKKDEPDVPPPPKPLPKIYINTENGLDPDSKENYLQATFSMTDAENFNMGETSMRIRGRGNWSWHQPKKPWRLNFPVATSLFGLEPSRNWVLLANYLDDSHLFNATGFEMARRLNMPFTNNTFFVELYLNGELRGVYTLTEHLKGNVKLETGDILFELDAYMDQDPSTQFYTSLIEIPVMCAVPENAAAKAKGMEIWEKVEQKLFAPNYEDTPEILAPDWRELFDVNSLMNQLLVSELMCRNISTFNSIYVRYVESDGKLHFGPVWDFDDVYQQGRHLDPDFDYWSKTYIRYTENQVDIIDREIPGVKFFYRFFDDPTFVQEYKEYCKSVIGKLNVDGYVDSLVTVIKPFLKTDFQIWNKNIDYNYEVKWSKNLFRARLALMKNYSKQ